MIRKDLIEDLAQGLGNRTAEQAVRTFFDTISGAMADGRLVDLRGFGRFTVRRHQARDHRNPRTGESIGLRPATRYPHFRAAKAVTDRLQRTRPDE